MRILVIGSGGREHALLHAMHGHELTVAPGNAGMSGLATVRSVDVASPEAIVALAHDVEAELVVIGPEVPLVAGAADALIEAGIPVFGPTQAAAQLEGSKAFAKDFMARHQIPTAAYRTFTADQIEECYAFIDELGGAKSVVLKADGLAGGKGVILPETDEEARQSAKDMLVHQIGRASCRERV